MSQSVDWLSLRQRVAYTGEQLHVAGRQNVGRATQLGRHQLLRYGTSGTSDIGIALWGSIIRPLVLTWDSMRLARTR